MLVADLKKTIREIPDFPKPGINFYDVSTLFRNPEALRTTIDRLVDRFRGERIDAVAGIEARGFILASALAYRLDLGMVMVRKLGKLPGDFFAATATARTGEASDEGADLPLTWRLDEVEKHHILRVLESSAGNKSKAARSLGVSRKTLERKLKSWSGG